MALANLRETGRILSVGDVHQVVAEAPSIRRFLPNTGNVLAAP